MGKSMLSSFYISTMYICEHVYKYIRFYILLQCKICYVCNGSISGGQLKQYYHLCKRQVGVRLTQHNGAIVMSAINQCAYTTLQCKSTQNM